MKRRIFAWILLAGFVFLILNLIVFRFYWQLSMVVYIIIVFAFMLTNGKLVHTQDSDNKNNSDDPNGSDSIGRYLDDAVILNNDADNKSNTADDTMNADNNDEASDAADDAEDK